jgi:uncharacterized protein YyaL (SSP411 family)
MKKPNRLVDETSPYLKQHAHNPVDWYPWGPQALERARKEQKPIFLSIGYSACHWCHVMERESFEDEETAKLMNEYFVNIKVDREERQDLDHIYMSAVQIMTQHGGWPMSVFLTPELEPFYGGTYFPPDDRMGMPSFKKILMGVAGAWKNRREEVVKSAKELTAALQGIGDTGPATKGTPSLDLIAQAVESCAQAFDPTYGGLGNAPKFFHTMNLKACLRHWARTNDAKALAIVTQSLDKIAAGGIYDQLGGGFHRYSTDQQWLVPHFEKMLYDNALLADLYLETFQITRLTEFAQTARETLDYVLREMTAAEGGFYSTQDADSEGVEGKFYVWSYDEIFKTLDQDVAAPFARVYQVTRQGNWEGQNILHRTQSIEQSAAELGLDKAWLEDHLALAKRKLLAVRAQRVAPRRDEKILVSWNALMIEAMARGYQVLGDERYLVGAQRAADFILKELCDKRGSNPKLNWLLHAYTDGQGRFNAYLDDYGGFVGALVSLFECDFQWMWLEAARGLATVMLDQFWDSQRSDFYYTARDHEKLITRPKENHDGATPSGTALAVTALLRLGKHLDQREFLKPAEEALAAQKGFMQMAPMGTGQLLTALDFLVGPPMEIAIVPASLEDRQSVLHLIHEGFLPNKIVASVTDDKKVALHPLLQGKKIVENQTTVYLCENYTCEAPLVGLDAFTQALESRRARKGG